MKVRRLLLPGLMWIGVAFMLFFTRIEPSANAPFIGQAQAQQFIILLEKNLYGVSTRTTAELPSTWPGTEMGTWALSILHFIGTGIFFFLISLGVLIGTRRREQLHNLTTVVGMAVAMMYSLMFFPSLFGMTMHQPTRWFPFIYILAAPLAGIAIHDFLTEVNVKVMAQILIVVVVVILFTGFMSVGYWGSPDGVGLDGPGSKDYSMTNQDIHLYEFIDGRAQASVVSDDLTATFLSRWYQHPSIGVRITQSYESENANKGDLLVERSYSNSSQATYRLRVDNGFLRVAGSVPSATLRCEADDKIYSSGDHYSVRQKLRHGCR